MLIIIPADVDDSSWANSVLPLLGFTGIDFRRASVKLAFPPGRSPFDRGEFGCQAVGLRVFDVEHNDKSRQLIEIIYPVSTGG